MRSAGIGRRKAARAPRSVSNASEQAEGTPPHCKTVTNVFAPLTMFGDVFPQSALRHPQQ
jgi:hypothetical protein